ncbi:MAG: RidA family protein, partial [Dehalococcoidia bacterium]
MDAILKVAGATWDDVVRVNQYISREDGIDPMRAGRRGYLPTGKALSTSVRCQSVHPGCIIQVGMEAYFGPRQTFTSPEVWVVPGTVQASRTGDTVYLQGQIPYEKQGNMVGRGDIVAQADRMYYNAGAMLEAAGATWDDVVHTRTYCLRREDFTPVRQVRAKYLKDGHYASTGLLAKFFTPHSPDMLLEVEFIAVT